MLKGLNRCEGALDMEESADRCSSGTLSLSGCCGRELSVRRVGAHEAGRALLRGRESDVALELAFPILEAVRQSSHDAERRVGGREWVRARDVEPCEVSLPDGCSNSLSRPRARGCVLATRDTPQHHALQQPKLLGRACRWPGLAKHAPLCCSTPARSANHPLAARGPVQTLQQAETPPA